MVEENDPCDEEKGDPSAKRESIPRSVRGAESDLNLGKDKSPGGAKGMAQSDSGSRMRAERDAGAPEVRLRGAMKQISIATEEIDELTRQAKAWEELLAAIEVGLTPTQALDYVAVRVMGYGQAEWGRQRGVTRQTVQGGVETAEKRIEELQRDEG